MMNFPFFSNVNDFGFTAPIENVFASRLYIYTTCVKLMDSTVL